METILIIIPLGDAGELVYFPLWKGDFFMKKPIY